MNTYVRGAMLCVLALAVGNVSADVTIYANDFEGGVGAEWLMLAEGATQWVTPPTSVTPGSNDGFLGEFSNGMVTLTLTNLPAHSEVTFSMDLYIIRSWDGNFAQDSRGPDFWGSVVGSVPSDPSDMGQWDSVTTFSNWHPNTGPHQAYPQVYGVGDNPARTGAAENNTLGYYFDNEGTPVAMDAVYEVSTGVLAHTGDTLTVTFGAMNLQAISDESWGIDDFEVVLDVPEPSTLVFMVLAGVFITRRS